MDFNHVTNGLVDLMKELRKKFLEITVRSSIKEYLISTDVSFCVCPDGVQCDTSKKYPCRR